MLLFLFSCNSEQEDKFKKCFNNTPIINIKSSALKLDQSKAILGYMFNMIYFDSLLFVNDYPDPQYCMKIVDFRRNTVLPFVKKGKGPNEIPAQSCDYSIDKIRRLLYVYSPSKYQVYCIDSIINSNLTPIENYSTINDSMKFHSYIYIEGNLIGSINKKRFGLYNKKKNLLIEKYDYSNTSEEAFLMTQSFLIKHPTENKIAFFRYNAASMGVITLGTNDFTIKDFIWWQPDIDNFKSYHQFLSSKNMRNGFITASFDENYIYTLYSGKVMEKTSLDKLIDSFLSNFLYVLDWQGKPIQRYKLDQNVRSFAIDEKNKIIYAASYQDSCHLIKYNYN